MAQKKPGTLGFFLSQVCQVDFLRFTPSTNNIAPDNAIERFFALGRLDEHSDSHPPGRLWLCHEPKRFDIF